MRQSKQKQIGECLYTVTPCGAVQGSRVFTRVLRLVGPLFGKKDLSAMFESLQDGDIDYLREAFSPLTQVKLPDGKEPILQNVFDDHFAGKYDEMLAWLMFCLEVNFGSMMRGKGVDAAMAKAKSALTGQGTPTGSSGASA